MARKSKWMMSALLITLVGTTATGIVDAKDQPTVHKVSTQAAILSPVAVTLARVVEADKVYTASGKLVMLPRNRPDMFAAWWCPHCHAALLQLKADNELGKVNLISIYVSGDTSKPVTTWKRARALTEDALHQLGVNIPASHIFLAMPNSPINTQIRGVPTLWKFGKHGVSEMVGTPSGQATWIQALV